MPCVLVVEDEAPLRRIIALNLARRGYQVIEAESVATAQAALEVAERPVDLILLDVNLPDQTGWELLRHQRFAPPVATATIRSGRTPPVIIVTAVRPAHSRVEEFQPAAVLLKPFPIDALLRLIVRVLASEPEEPGEQASQHPTLRPDLRLLPAEERSQVSRPAESEGSGRYG